MNKITKIIKRVLNNQSNKNIFTMLLGTTGAQVIPIVASLILTRIYSPEEYGMLAIFTSIIIILGSIATLRFELAILVPEKEQDAVNITLLSAFCSFLFSLFVLIIILMFKERILTLLNIEGLGNWLYLIPFSVLFLGLYNTLSFLSTRVGIFKVISKTRVYQALSGSLSQIILGLLQLGIGGLVLGVALSHIVGNMRLVQNLLETNEKEFKNTNFNAIKVLAKRYSDYPKYSVPSTILNNLSLHLMNFIIPIIYTPFLLGQYSLSQRIVVLPMKVISNSIAQVFLNEASLELKLSNRTRNSFLSTFKRLILISIPLYAFLFFFIEDLIVFAYGSEWGKAGEIAKILIVLLFFRFITSPLSNVLNLYEKQKLTLVWQFSLLILTVISLIFTVVFELSFYDFLVIYVVLLSLDYLIMLIICWIYSNRNKD